MDGGKCPVGVVTAMEAEQLAAQRQTYLGCRIVARCCCLGAENLVVKVHHMLAYPRVGPLKNIKTTLRWIRLLSLGWPRGYCMIYLLFNLCKGLWLLKAPFEIVPLPIHLIERAVKEEMQHIDGLVIEGWT
ncbi:LOW QUALITY PROTEIN: hypothetical protein QYF61_022696 [Mycteria americana]|uniref:Uncharacterized protein n=1 Tax=Mycteria americana TaxID=33587 RepID=A0AAN7NPB7_MYCAM|nr:LOW QUALITY PROTEIN: hypothetical protein QYF61_022696 [Mycteria americana]